MNKKLLFMIPVLALSLLAGCTTSNAAVEVKPANDSPSVVSEAEEATHTVRFHYQRADKDYKTWGIWLWRYKPNGNGYNVLFDKTDDFGGVCDVSMTEGPHMNAEVLGFIIKTDVAKPTEFGNATRDPKTVGDRYVYLEETSPGGIQHVWLCENDAEVYETREASQKNKVLSGDFTTTKKINVKVAFDGSTKTIAASQFHLYAGNEEMAPSQYSYSIKDTSISVTLKNEADITKQYKVKIDFPDKSIELSLGVAVFYGTKQFQDNYTYYGDDLGVTFNPTKTKTTFKLWAPVSSNVTLNIYDYGTEMQDKNEKIQTLPSKRYQMRHEQQGVWSITIPAYLHGKYYTYTVENGTAVNEVVDPYAKGCGINGKRGLIVDFDKVNAEIEGWDTMEMPNQDLKSNVDAVVYEAHVRDMTISETSGVPREEKGTFKGLARRGTTYTDPETNKTVSTGFDHILELGVTHVQIEPFYDYASTEETEVLRYENDLNYNWGYDPYNYNCLEGGYSTDPHNGFTRIIEYKNMVKTFHENDVGIIMDVVYNHTAKGPDSWFNLIVPGYYYRLLPDGAFYNDSGCGNTVATERPMARKYIIDSLKFWTEEYKMSGFRFDLMGLIDTTTLAMAYAECEQIYDKIMMYGEPWPQGNDAEKQLGYQGAVTSRLGGIYGIGGFNDRMRDATRGNTWEGKANTGWVQGNASDMYKIENGIKGTFDGEDYIDPTKVVNYVSCHDNYTLYDQLHISNGRNDFNIANRSTQADAMIMFAQGIPFIQEGEEFLRTKDKEYYTHVHETNPEKKCKYCESIHNSYNAGDSFNTMDYELKAKNFDVFTEIKEQIQLRREVAAFRLDTRTKVKSALTMVACDANLVAYKLSYEGKTYYIAHGGTNGCTLYETSGYTLAYSNKTGASFGGGLSYSLAANESIVLVK